MSFTSLRRSLTRSRSARAKRVGKALRGTLRSRRLCHEPLEQRTLLAVGSIAGTVFEDLDADGVQDVGEDGLVGWDVAIQRTDALQTFTNALSGLDDRFGASVAGLGDDVLVCAAQVPAVYLLDGETGATLRTFLPPGPGDSAARIAAMGDNVLVGIRSHDEGAGAAYLFNGSTGDLLRTFSHPAPETTPQFGNDVAAFNGNVLIGTGQGPNYSGDALLMDAADGSVIRTFQSPTPLNGDGFGRALAVSGNRILIGAPEGEGILHYGGAVYLFDGNTGNLLQSFFNPLSAENDQFGESVAFLGNDVLVGAMYDDTRGVDAGIAYLFDAETGDLVQTFLNPNPGTPDKFGISVGAVGGNVFVGAPELDAGPGALYFFDPQSGALISTISNPTPDNGDRFGKIVRAWGDRILVGSTRDDAGNPGAGAAYAFEAPEITWTDSQGDYTFTGLESDAYQISEIAKPDYTQTAPGGDGTYSVTLAAGDNLTGLDFGNRIEPILLFADSFENGEWDGKWVEDSQNDWFTSTQRKTDGNYSAEVDGRATDATLTMAQAVDMTLYGSAELTFDWYIESGFDSGEYVALDFSPDGSTWTEIKRLRGNVDQENTWHNETIGVDPAYLTDGFKMRYRAYVSGSREDANVDNVQLWATSLAAPPNQSPVAVDDAKSTDEDTAVVINVLANDSDPDGDTLQVDSVGAASHGAVVNNGDGTVTYTPNLNFNGNDSFSYTLGDGNGGSDMGTVNVTVNPVNDAPTADSQSPSTNEDTALAVTLTGNDVDGDPLTFAVVDGPNNGSLSGTAPDLTYTPNGNFNGSDSFTFRVNDGSVDSDLATVDITVDPVNDAPVVASSIADMSVDEDAADTVLDLSGTFSDVDTGDSLTLSVQSNSNSTLVAASLVGNTLTLDYQPDQNGSATITIRGTDGSSEFAEDTFLVTVDPVNDAPVAVDDSYSVDQDTVLNVPADGVLDNDTDVDGDSLSALITSQPTDGSVTLNADGSLTYTPDPGFYGGDSFTYQADDASLSSNIATVTITVNRVNNIPVALNDAYSVNEDSPLDVAASGVLGNDTDADSDPLTADLVNGPTDGSLTLNDDGSSSYTPDANFAGGDSFTYVANDGFADSNVATVSITVNAVNDDPVADSQSVVTNEDTPIAITLTGSDADNDPLTYAIVDGPTSGSLSGTIPNLTYTPGANSHGSDSFTFIVNDGIADSAIAVVSITVHPVNDQPTADAQSPSTAEDLPLAITLTGGDIWETGVRS